MIKKLFNNSFAATMGVNEALKVSAKNFYIFPQLLLIVYEPSVFTEAVLEQTVTAPSDSLLGKYCAARSSTVRMVSKGR